MKESILVIGAKGQIGSELVEELRRINGSSQVIATDIKEPSPELRDGGPFVQLDVLDFPKVQEVVRKNNVKQVYLLAALLSATAEQKIKSAWKLNMEGLLGTLEMAREEKFKLFWPSSIAVFGPSTPKVNTPQFTITEPSTVYGISKLAGERWCEYYFQKFGVDVRSIRYPGLIGYKTEPGGGTTDYAVHIFHEALKTKTYESFLSENTALPMMYMHDALNATIGLMDADASRVKVRSSYNIASMSFTPKQLADEICKHIPEFKITYKPDVRQQYADSWPQSIDDSVARADWGWQHEYDLAKMTKDMLEHIQHMLVH
ncbi:MAG: NAD-dependent epimerase/dehydratase family protein [Bacteroidetes bacterium]|nr:NAD-dependent epimerase/dehydratase family protein [Bacteroidota bacterium]MBL0065245.1 NAD-dependent epimerase/dehydratase family protein [Bacteroidota bacterium]MBL0138364.1 NAD-dependent epimerase/dehydratase family protein [Bacteroidota bacterium]